MASPTFLSLNQVPGPGSLGMPGSTPNLQRVARYDGTEQRQVDLYELDISLVSMVSSKPAKAT